MGNDRIAVPGGGSVGLCMAANFAQAGAEVTLLLRGGRAGEIGDRGFAVSGLLDAHRPEPRAICLAESHAPDARTLSCDMLLVATRACDLAEARGRHAGWLDGRNPVLLPRNGLGTAELARSILGDDVPVYSAAMMIGMVRRGPAEVAVAAHAGPLRCSAPPRRRWRPSSASPRRASCRSRMTLPSATRFSSRCCSTAA
ncbi:2-dehydropantoate 2-reductase [Poseidonocella sp. HB161398]|uniref:2-dehydropantoate 2-reductase n=1 Tax=Poseidonocella sp. HB161398 TaxID=2320855 RepID=UPI0014863676|nr:2-dehydropantoate 2-reductase [Poseidonocella sp. HB161398]